MPDKGHAQLFGKSRGGALVASWCVATVVFALLAVASAYADLKSGYNDSGYNFATGGDTGVYGGNAGLYQREPETSAPSMIRAYSGPHGGYTTTTQKCADCHAVHNAIGGFMLTRADSRESACDFCHVGGGGSKTNIQMDNAYGAQGAVTTASAGLGTGHSLGYASPAPADIRPAYESANGFSCLDCHTPHAAATRVLTTFADPGREMGTDRVSAVYSGSTLLTSTITPPGIDLSTYNGGSGSFWGVTFTQGNIATVDGGMVEQLPVWPTGRFLLIKNPDSAEPVNDMTVGDDPGGDGQLGYNKIQIDWSAPLGPSRTGDQNAREGGSYFGGIGMLSVGEFCSDCHDGTPGASTQRARAWKPDNTDKTLGQYVITHSHDAQPRDHDRHLLLDPGGTASNPDGTDDNFGPTCRKCHTGGSACNQCHGTDEVGAPRAAYSPQPIVVDGKSSFWPQAYVKHSAITGLGSQCIDGGFSWPHRTLGANLLQDELFGVDFDGSPIAPGEVRTVPAAWTGYLDGQPYETEPVTASWKPFFDPTASIAGAAAENLDSACITCHGDASYWNGDDPDYHVTEGGYSGWELITKGLP